MRYRINGLPPGGLQPGQHIITTVAVVRDDQGDGADEDPASVPAAHAVVCEYIGPAPPPPPPPRRRRLGLHPAYGCACGPCLSRSMMFTVPG